jgi:hypothetical protein
MIAMSAAGIPDRLTDDDYRLEFEKLGQAYTLYVETCDGPPSAELLNIPDDFTPRWEKIYADTKILKIVYPNWKPKQDVQIWLEKLESCRAAIALAAITRWELAHQSLPEPLDKVMREIGVDSIPINPFVDTPLPIDVSEQSVSILLVGRNAQRDPPQPPPGQFADDFTMTMPRRYE